MAQYVKRSQAHRQQHAKTEAKKMSVVVELREDEAKEEEEDDESQQLEEGEDGLVFLVVCVPSDDFNTQQRQDAKLGTAWTTLKF